MKNKNYRIIAYIVSILPLLAAVFIYPKLPSQIPIHWDLDGSVSYGDKSNILFLLFMSIGLTILMDILPRIDPRKKNYEKFNQYYDGFVVGMAIFMLLIEGIIISECFYPGRISVGKVVIILVGLLFLMLGNIMPKIKSNYYMGIKTPWTLSDENVWNKTQRLGGHLMFVSGILLLVSGFFLNETVTIWVLMGIVGIITIIPTAMSYVWYRSTAKKDTF